MFSTKLHWCPNHMLKQLQVTLFNMEKHQVYFKMSELLSLPPSLSPATLWRKPIWTAYIQNITLSVITKIFTKTEQSNACITADAGPTHIRPSKFWIWCQEKLTHLSGLSSNPKEGFLKVCQQSCIVCICSSLKLTTSITLKILYMNNTNKIRNKGQCWLKRCLSFQSMNLSKDVDTAVALVWTQWPVKTTPYSCSIPHSCAPGTWFGDTCKWNGQTPTIHPSTVNHAWYHYCFSTFRMFWK